MDEFNLLKIKNRLKPLNRRLKDSFDRKALNDALIKLEERAIGEHLFDEIRSDINSKSRKNTDKWNDPEEVKKTVTVAKIMYTSRRISIDKYVFFAVFPVEAYHEKRMDIELDPINQKIDEIQKKHGLEEDEYWQIGEGPKEYINLIKKWEDIYDSLFLKTLKEFDLDDLADMILNDTNRFEQLRERGRRAVFHSNETIPIIKDIVVRFEEDARRAASVKAYSAAVLSLGAAIEGLLVLRCLESPKKASRIASKLPARMRPRASHLNDPTRWHFETLIEVCSKADWLPPFKTDTIQFNAAGLAHSIRLLRNHVHPGRHFRERPWSEINDRDFNDAEAIYTVLFKALQKTLQDKKKN
ncbi:MAG: hypothetical protein HOG49_20050 [Candidatus Scalindua sp.]|nr:hypothetical protein [Candidatus Scalindua sp.]